MDGGVVSCLFLALMALLVSWNNKPRESRRPPCVPKSRNHTGKILTTRRKWFSKWCHGVLKIGRNPKSIPSGFFLENLLFVQRGMRSLEEYIMLKDPSESQSPLSHTNPWDSPENTISHPQRSDLITCFQHPSSWNFTSLSASRFPSTPSLIFSTIGHFHSKNRSVMWLFRTCTGVSDMSLPK